MEMNQRRNRRFSAEHACFAALQDDETVVGKIRDISMEGLSFESAKQDDDIIDFSQLDIFCPDDIYYLPQIPCKVVYVRDQNSKKENHQEIEESSTIRCGIRFTQMEKSQRKELESLIESQMGVLFEI